MLLEEHAEYHKIGPVEAKFKDEKPVLHIQVMRQTSATGEQINIECPVYGSDTREDMMARINMCYSILQDRLEDENKALLRMKEKAEAEQKAKEQAIINERIQKAEEKRQKKALKAVVSHKEN